MGFQIINALLHTIHGGCPCNTADEKMQKLGATLINTQQMNM